MGKKTICIAAMLMLTGGCVQKQESGQGIAGRVAINVNVDKVFDLARETSKQDKEKSKDEKISDSTKKEAEEKQTADSNQAAEKQSTPKRPDTSQETQSSKSIDNKEEKQSSSSSSQELANQDTKQQDKEQEKSAEPTKPIETAVPEPPVPSCDDTIPVGAYPVSREDEICSQIEAEMIKNLVEGKPTFDRYEIEYGYTGCGSEYFYIIYK